MKDMKVLLCRFAAVAIAAALFVTAVPMKALAETTWNEALEATDEYLEEHQNSEDWSNFAMARKLDSDLTDSKFVEYGEKIESTDFSEKDASEYTSALLALESIGRGGSEKSEELTKKLMEYNSSDMFFSYSSAQTKANMLQGLQGQADLNTAAYQDNKASIDSAIAALKADLAGSKESDGDYWKSWGNKDIDTTAAVADALMRYTDTAALASGASDWIIGEKAADGGYGYEYDWGTFTITGPKTNVNSTAMALIALAENGKSAQADTAVSAMMGHYLGDGTFEYDVDTYGTKVSNDMATEQADYALVAYDRSKTAGATSLFDFSDVTAVYYFSFDGSGASGTMKTQGIKAGDTKNLNANAFINSGYKFVGWKDAAGNTYTDEQAVKASKDVKLYAVWEKTDAKNRIPNTAPVVTSYTFYNLNSYYYEAMRVKTENAATGDWKLNETTGKWMFFIDGKPVKGQWVTAINPSAGSDKAGRFYFDENGEMLTGWQKLAGEDGIERWYYLNPHPDVWFGACFINTITPDGYLVDKNGAWMDPNLVSQEEIAKATEKALTGDSATGSSEKAEETKNAKKITVSVSVNGNIVSGSDEVKLNKNASAYDALKALAKKMGWSILGGGSYVKGIGGEKEKSAGPQSGWTYSVNGTTPQKSAGSYKLKDGDSVDWTFVDEPDY